MNGPPPFRRHGGNLAGDPHPVYVIAVSHDITDDGAARIQNAIWEALNRTECPQCGGTGRVPVTP